MTPKQLADAAGTNHQTIASIEAGQKDCPADLKRQIDLVLRDRMRRAEQAIRG
jgi:DNA-binding XRE family transcriptional regulator